MDKPVKPSMLSTGLFWFDDNWNIAGVEKEKAEDESKITGDSFTLLNVGHKAFDKIYGNSKSWNRGRVELEAGVPNIYLGEMAPDIAVSNVKNRFVTGEVRLEFVVNREYHWDKNWFSRVDEAMAVINKICGRYSLQCFGREIGDTECSVMADCGITGGGQYKDMITDWWGWFTGTRIGINGSVYNFIWTNA